MDTSDSIHIIGAEMDYDSEATNQGKINQFITAFFYQVCLYSVSDVDLTTQLSTTHTCGTGYCSTCPSSDGATASACLIDCDANEFLLENGTCGTCLETCPDGCTNPDNCNPCVDEQCKKCSGDWVTCEECIEGAIEVDGNCICEQLYNAEENKCEFCSEGCMTCTGTSEYECEECAAGWYMQPAKSFCLQYCPTGYTADDVSKECTGTPGEIDCITFNVMVQDECTGDDCGIKVISGDADPTPVYKRGVWFDGNTYAELQGIVLSNTFTVQFWARVTSPGNLFSINSMDGKVTGEEQWLNIKAGAEDAVDLTIAGNDFTFPAIYTAESWDLIAVSANWSQVNQ
jgi:hypothetical protein